MDDVAEVGAKAKGGRGKKGGAAAKKAGNDGDATVAGQVGRMLVRSMWSQAWAAANPAAKGEARKTAWQAARAGEMEKNLKSFRRAVTSLQKAGVTITLSTAAAAATPDEDDGGED